MNTYNVTLNEVINKTASTTDYLLSKLPENAIDVVFTDAVEFRQPVKMVTYKIQSVKTVNALDEKQAEIEAIATWAGIKSFEIVSVVNNDNTAVAQNTVSENSVSKDEDFDFLSSRLAWF